MNQNIFIDVNFFKKELKTINIITFSKHFEEPKIKLRGITKEEILRYLGKPDSLKMVEDQGEELEGHKYGLLFHKSNKYDLKVVVSIKDKTLNVIPRMFKIKKGERRWKNG